MDKQLESQKMISRMFSEQMSFLGRIHEYALVQEQSENKKELSREVAMAISEENPTTPSLNQQSTAPQQKTGLLAQARDVVRTPSSGTSKSRVPERQGTSQGFGHDVIAANNYSHLELAEVGRKETRVKRAAKEVPVFKDAPYAFLKNEASRILHWYFFEPAMGILIVVNAINVGWAIDQELRNHNLPREEQVSETTKAIEHTLLAVFTMELLLRIFAHGVICLKSAWNALDFVLIILAYGEIITKFLIRDVDDGGVLKQILVLRMFRILRLARAFRLVKKFRSLWNLCQGLMNCVGTMISAFFLMAGTTFLFGCFGAELITIPFRNDDQIGQVIEERFSTMPMILLTLLQFITMDSISTFYWPLILKQPVLIVYFVALLMGVSIALMNLVTAMLVEEAISNQRMDDEMAAFYTRQKLKSLQPHFRSLFRGFDITGDGVIRVGEILQTMERGMVIPKELQEVVNHARVIDLFDALDKDQSGFITEDEFVEGLGYMAMSDVPLETMQILHLLRNCTRELSKLKKEIRGTSLMVSKISPEMAVRSV